MTTLPWDYSEEAEPGQGVPNQPTDEGRLLGAELARLTKPELERMALLPGAPVPCGECAFVAGTVPNGCLPTVADALKCVVEGRPFYCHKGMVDGEPKRLCAGWVAGQLAALEGVAKARKGDEG